MHSLLTKYLNKLGIEDPNSLSSEEKATFEGWQQVLSKEKLTIEDVQAFLKSQIDTIELKWRDLNAPNEKKAELIPYHTVYKLLQVAIDAPQAARQAAEIQLQQLINQK